MDDIIENQRRKAFQKTESLQKAILHSERFSIIATDETGIIQLFNAGAEHMLGYTAAEVVDKISPSDMHDPQEVMQRAAALSIELGATIQPGFEALAYKASRGIEDTYELTYIRKDGSRFPVVISISALRSPRNKLIGYLLIGTDNSVRSHVAAELSKAKAAAEAANLAKSDFLSTMSHELRSPLNAILGFAQLLESDPVPQTATQKESTGQILQAGWYLLDLINEILDLALIESGKLLLSQEPMSLHEVMHDCHAMMEPQALASNVSMTFPMLTCTQHIHADRTRVKQVLVNLLSNAIKYNRPGGEVVVDCATISTERVRISVLDTGLGLSPDQLAQLFQPFNRLGQECSGEEGTGIGLVMTKRLVELMGGEIGVRSTVGVGSVFWVELLLSENPPHDPDESEAAHSATTPAQQDPEVRTLLYVEDNPANLKLVEQLIARRPSMRLLSARDASLGIQLARNYQPEVILMDINLPGINGNTALAILREDPITQHIPVIAVSANAMPHDVERGLKAGFFRYLTKPLKVNEFMDALDLALSVAREKAKTGINHHGNAKNKKGKSGD